MNPGVRKLFLLFGLFAALFLALRYIFPLISPFLLGALLALAAEPMVRFFRKVCRFPQALASAVGVSMAFALLALVLMLTLGFLFRELRNLAGILPDVTESLRSGMDALSGWLLGIARRIELSRELGWKAAWEANCFRFSQVFLEYYTAWPREANLGYFRRMEAQLARALPDLLRCRRVWLRHKLYLLLIRWSPAVFLALRKQKRRF